MNNKMVETVKLVKFIPSGAKILSDRDEGIKARKSAELDRCDRENIDVIIEIPKNELWNITPSFFGGMFGTSIIKYGETFWDHYSFQYGDGQALEDELREKIEYDVNYILERIE